MLVKAIVEAGTSAVLGYQVQAGAPKNIRAHSLSVECIHGMDEGGVQFSVGPKPQFFKPCTEIP